MPLATFTSRWKTSSSNCIARSLRICLRAFAHRVNRYIGDGARYGVHHPQEVRGHRRSWRSNHRYVRKILTRWVFVVALDSVTGRSQRHCIGGPRRNPRAVRTDNVRSGSVAGRLDATNDRARAGGRFTTIQPELSEQVTLADIARSWKTNSSFVELILGSNRIQHVCCRGFDRHFGD